MRGRDGESVRRVRDTIRECPWLSDHDVGNILGLSQQAVSVARVRSKIPALPERKRALATLLLSQHPDATVRDLCAMAEDEGLPMHEKTMLRHRQALGLARTRWGRR